MDITIQVSGKDADVVDRVLKLIVAGELREYPGVNDVYTDWCKDWSKEKPDKNGNFADTITIQVDQEEMRKATEGGRFCRIHWKND